MFQLEKEGISGENWTGNGCICRANKDACIQDKMAAGWRSLDQNLRFKKLNCIHEQSPKSFGALARIFFPSIVILPMQTFQLGEGTERRELTLQT